MQQPDWERFDPSVVIGRRVYGFGHVGSTMDVAWELAEAGAAHGTAVIAGAQAQGRGRLARTWVSGTGESLLVSVLLRSPASLTPLLTMVGCLAARETVWELTRLETTIKWPNDLLYAGKKLCGVLVEGRTDTAGESTSVLGIGINVRLDVEAHEELRGRATSLRGETGKDVDLARAAEALFASLNRVYRDAEGGADIIGRWRAALETLGKRVSVRERDGTLTGMAEDVDEVGRLLVRTDEGALRVVSEGDVTLAG